MYQNFKRSFILYTRIRMIAVLMFSLSCSMLFSQKVQDTTQVLDLIKETWKLKDIKVQDSLADLAFSKSVALNYEKGISLSVNLLSRTTKLNSKPEEILAYVEKALNAVSENSLYKSGILSVKALYFKSANAKDSAFYYLNKSLEAAIDKEGNQQIARAYISMANYWHDLQDMEKSLKFYIKADSVLQSDPKLANNRLRATVYNYMGYTVRLTSGYDKALQYYLKAKDVYNQLNDRDGLSEVNIAIAQAYANTGQPEKAIPLLDEALEYNRQYGTTNDLSYNIIVRGYTYLKMKNFEKAEKDYFAYYDLAKQMKSEASLINALGYMAYFYTISGQDEKALEYYKKVMSYYEDDNFIFKKEETLLAIIENLERQQKWKEAAEYYKKLLETQATKAKNELTRNTEALEVALDTKQKEKKIELLEVQNTLSEQQNANQRNLFFASAVIFTIALLSLFFLYRNRQKTNRKLKELDALKSDFFANISHEFRTPLALISGPLEQQLQKKELEETEERNLKIAKKNVNRLLELVDQMLDLSKLESGFYTLKVAKADLSFFLKATCTSFEYQAEQKQQEYHIAINSKTSEGWFDKDVLEKIITNLVSNAIKYSPENAEIKIDALIEKEQLMFSVKNSGAMLSNENIQTIFDRFQRADEQTSGAGIGLALTKELVELHKGSIEVSSDNNYTVFTIKLPVAKSSFTEDEITTALHHIDTKTELTPHSSSSPGDMELVLSDVNEESVILEDSQLPVLLMVDDNKDLREYVSSLFEDDYKVYTAKDGQEGFKKAKKLVPDVIITDLMMPEEDGYKLTINCKTDDTTSHIPILMLTAKAGDENELQGLETGADAYITKPFNTEILKTTVFNLLEIRRKLQERFSQEVVLKPADISVNSYDERFLENLQQVMDDNLVESDFSAEKFAQALGMSRMQLHRKLKALTGKSATEFVRSQRLKLAAQLLKKSETNISQVGYAVGFNNHSYFASCFKEEFGVSPSDYAKR
ncbi:response regulator [Flavobacteriaceae bacterium M23B6Z8]